MSLELLVVAFYHVSRIDAASDLLREVIEGKHVGIGLQRIDDFWILPVSLRVEGFQPAYSSFPASSSIYCLEILRDFSTVTYAALAGNVSLDVKKASLDPCHWIDRADDLFHSVKAIRAEERNTSHSALPD
jgi:hypothetical protein